MLCVCRKRVCAEISWAEMFGETFVCIRVKRVCINCLCRTYQGIRKGRTPGFAYWSRFRSARRIAA